ncbi:DEP domain-containing protein 1B-like [Lineus longissimus]|uniref:DEP domain-containing protein 1B-like n=1 Tax=Lineus longissimus TaxID=88925 RepID=UPI002B4E87AA
MENTSQSSSGPYRATKLWNEVLHAFRDNMPIGRHRRNMRTYEHCFVASDSVDWLHEYLKRNSNFGAGVSRYQTAQLLQKFHKGQVFVDVRGSKHKEQFQDNGRLYRFVPKSPVKNNRTPLKRKKNLGNQTPVHRPLKLDFTDVVKPVECRREAELPKCHLVAKQLTTEEIENVFRTATLAKLRRLLGVHSLDEIIEMPKVKGQHVRHNLTHLNKTGVVTNIIKEEQLPHWILSAMRCLAYWPDQGEDNFSQRYPGFERDVFRAVKEHFQSLDEPLLTYDNYELFVNVLLHIENPDPRRSTPQGNSTYGFSPMSQESFVSVENLVLSMASPASQQLKLSQWNVSQINSSMENFEFLPPARPMTSSQPNLLDSTFVSEDSACPNRYSSTFYDNFAFERTDSDRSQNGNLQRHYSSNNLNDAENYLQNMTMRSRKQSNGSLCSEQSGTSTVSGRSGRSGVSHMSGRSGVSHISGRSAYSTSTAYSTRSGMNAATTRADPGYSHVRLARTPNAKMVASDLNRSCSYPNHEKYREPPPQYRNPPPYGSIHRKASIQTLNGNQSASERTPVNLNSRRYVRRRMTRSVYSALWDHSSSVFSETHENKLISALQICCLLLPPGNRRKLHLLLRLMNKMVNNTELHLDDDLPIRTQVLQTFCRCIIVSAMEGEFDEQTSLCLTAFMMDNYDRIMVVPQDLKEHIETRLAEMQRAQVKYVEDPVMVTFCKRLTQEEYEQETLSNSELAIADLLEAIVKNEKMAFKEKKKKLKQFQKEYPKIYQRKFPNAESEAAVIPAKSKSRTPLLSKLKTMRL